MVIFCHLALLLLHLMASLHRSLHFRPPPPWSPSGLHLSSSLFWFIHSIALQKEKKKDLITFTSCLSFIHPTRSIFSIFFHIPPFSSHPPSYFTLCSEVLTIKLTTDFLSNFFKIYLLKFFVKFFHWIYSCLFFHYSWFCQNSLSRLSLIQLIFFKMTMFIWIFI